MEYLFIAIAFIALLIAWRFQAKSLNNKMDLLKDENESMEYEIRRCLKLEENTANSEELSQLEKAAILLGSSGIDVFPVQSRWGIIKTNIKPYLTKEEWKKHKRQCKGLIVSDSEIVKELLLMGISFEKSIILVDFVCDLSVRSSYTIKEASKKIAEVIYKFNE